ncbi:hypothetical protein P170DRAFT_438177 [Aspergillus steynii IBT 23096]|uniref:Kelch repeat protein n=1 Tax=Aspergillus steynii IBT 23096 TaxID=1392250 RepID=A0A2I2G0E2_9EURO|nr:uncharacterized protein P170DRAFT_438177 [Aspergillus steynii IBT 23096]PLB46355.1 hypothetical protein P170DRAFT_438177 [Aspergillus steynii IBT 23096]
MPPFWPAAALWTVLASLTSAQDWRNQVNVSICNWAQLRANTIRDKVYLDGGYLWREEGYTSGAPQFTSDDNQEGKLYYLNLSSTFDTSSDNLTALFGSIPKAGAAANNLAPNYRDGVMFANDDQLYLYGGLLRSTESQDPPAGDRVLGYEKYQYGPYRSSWEAGFYEDQLDNDVTRYVTHGAGASAPSENLGFYFSGMHGANWGSIADDQSANRSSQRMIKVDMSEMRGNVWSNTSLPDYVPARANAELVWLPVSDSGVLVAIGGVLNPESIYRTDGLSNAQMNASQRASPGFMETVSVYDIADEKWYVQNTTGDIPPALAQFCSVYASASDGSSHNIYIYGGYDGLETDSDPSDDVYVLSLPSFEWIKLFSGQKQHGRHGHKCVKPYPDKMLVLGGKYKTVTDCLDGGIVQVFNLNTGRFQDKYDPQDWGEYKVPDLVTGRIGGDSKGSAKTTSPKSWTNSSLEGVFLSKYTKTITSWYPYNRTDNSTPRPTVSVVPDKKNGFPGWAGAIIGVVLGLLLIAGAIAFWCFRRRRRAKGSQQTSEESGKRSHIMRWMYTGSQGMEEGAKTNDTTTASVSYRTYQANDSTVEQSVTAAATSPRTIEAGSDPIFEMHDNSTTPPVELPTSYNNNPLPSPTPSGGSGSTGFVSPLSPQTASRDIQEADDAPVRPAHHRHVSSLSSVRSFSIANMIHEDGGTTRHAHRPSHVSDVSETSVSSEGTRVREGSGQFSSSEGDWRLETTREVDERDYFNNGRP